MNEIAPNLSFIVICPCCGKPAEIKFEETDNGEIQVCLFHMPETPIEDVSKYGVEFGSTSQGEGGE